MRHPCANIFYCKFYPYLFLRIIRVIFSIREIELADIRGISFINIPYVIHKVIPNVSITSIGKDKSFVCLVLIAFIACGKNANVVKLAAANPTTIKYLSIQTY